MTEKKNMKKRDSYALAHDMINEAIKAWCPLQAITIEESILSDRLWSALNSQDRPRRGRHHDTLGDALREWKDTKGSDCLIVLDEKASFSLKELNDFWEDRNELLHGIVKSFSGEAPSIEANQFRERAMLVAITGKNLVKEVQNWSKRAIRKASKVNK